MSCSVDNTEKITAWHKFAVWIFFKWNSVCVKYCPCQRQKNCQCQKILVFKKNWKVVNINRRVLWIWPSSPGTKLIHLTDFQTLNCVGFTHLCTSSLLKHLAPMALQCWFNAWQHLLVVERASSSSQFNCYFSFLPLKKQLQWVTVTKAHNKPNQKMQPHRQVITNITCDSDTEWWNIHFHAARMKLSVLTLPVSFLFCPCSLHHTTQCQYQCSMYFP